MIKKAYIATLLIGVINLSGCGGGGSDGDITNSDDPLTQSNIRNSTEGSNRNSTSTSEAIYNGKWLKPSKSICENNGGEYNTNDKQECRADWEHATEICSLSGATLPSIGELKQVVLDCGGEIYLPPTRDINITERNQANSSYQACYKEKGFSSGSYYSSDAHAYASYSIWHILFLTGYQLLSHQDLSSNIRCLK